MKVLMYDVSNLLFRMMSVGLKMNERADNIEKLIRVESPKAQYIVTQSKQDGKMMLDFFNVTQSPRKTHSSLKTEEVSFTVEGEIVDNVEGSLFKISPTGEEDSKKLNFAQEMGKLAKQNGIKVEFLLDINGIMYSVKESIKKDIKEYGNASASPIYCFDSKNWRQDHLTQYYVDNAERVATFVKMGMAVSAPIYKDGRPDKNQYKIRELIKVFTEHLEETGQTSMKKVGFEADDLLVYVAKEIEKLDKEATVAGLGGKTPTDITIISADKDIGVNASSERTRVHSPNTKRLFTNNPITIAANYCELMVAGDKIDSIEPIVPETIIDINGVKVELGVSFKKEGIKTVLADYVEENMPKVNIPFLADVSEEESAIAKRYIAELLVQKRGHGFTEGNEALVIGLKKTASGTAKKFSVVEEKAEYEDVKEVLSTEQIRQVIETITKSEFANKEILEKRFKAHLTAYITEKYVSKYVQALVETTDVEMGKKWAKLNKKSEDEKGLADLVEFEKEFSAANPVLPKRQEIKKVFEDVVAFYLKINEDVIDINRMPAHIKGDMVKYVDQVLPEILFEMNGGKKNSKNVPKP